MKALNLENPPTVTMIVDRQLRKDGSLEPDLLPTPESRRAPLVFKTLEGKELVNVFAEYEWSQESLMMTAKGVALMFPMEMYQGANAYVGGVFVGSTEV
ncbi:MULTISPECIES: hypothetical protein [Halomonadaceae]|uniref:hypothetical protein n=1 Tax=Halomonadaceae TaxID=28256 RepID=UPI003CFA6034